ncbi:MAG: hypothetical protein IT582_00385 [Opitutaceae bacterium]|nr:hypothetical protein [Opitutaceae bacterium]
MSNHDPEKLEKLIHQSLRALPERRAPRSLELRVMAAIEARQALPWWRQSFAHWPQPAKAAFFVLAGALAAVLFTLVFRTGAGSASSVTGALDLLAPARRVFNAIADIGAAVFRGIPPLWLYGGLAFVAAMYAALVGLGATAYRTLIYQR